MDQQLAPPAAAGDPAPDLPPDRPRAIRALPTAGDRVFRGVLRGAGSAVLVVMGLIAAFLVYRAGTAIKATGWGFLTTQDWTPGTHRFGVGSMLPNGILIAVIALLIAVPVSLAAALYISEYAPERLRRPLISLVDLMAAVPSIVYGLWGLFFLQPALLGTLAWVSRHLGFLPFLTVRFGDAATSYTSSTLIAGVVVSLMVIPIVTSLSREVFSQAPQGEREGAHALGGTRWGMIRTVVLPFGRGGVIGAVMLGFGRAMGETIAVALIISPVYTVAWHVLERGGNSIPAMIALRYSEAGDFNLSALMAAGLVLFLVTLVVNVLASVVISRSRSGAVTAD
ncbi:phosphate ABC transporter permease subunit PstC [Peterkaempfera sp. SMS 1(5)a]|uniref:phosphate ABC transporter permease subunit PstC n=1 Tax=Peterkaempfera podocarpi TaxID=3232308 RepID=UPI00366CCFE1